MDHLAKADVKYKKKNQTKAEQPEMECEVNLETIKGPYL